MFECILKCDQTTRREKLSPQIKEDGELSTGRLMDNKKIFDIELYPSSRPVGRA